MTPSVKEEDFRCDSEKHKRKQNLLNFYTCDNTCFDLIKIVDGYRDTAPMIQLCLKEV